MLRSLVATALVLVACGGATAVESSNSLASDASAPSASPTVRLPMPPDASPPDPGFRLLRCDNPDAAAPPPLTTIPASCAKDYVVCRDGTYLARTGASCELPTCPCKDECDLIGSDCPDGTMPTSDVPNCGDHCAAPSCEALSKHADARERIQDGYGCRNDDDCAFGSVSLSCSPSCTVPVTKPQLKDLESLRQVLENSYCALFRAQGCVSPPTPPCDPPGAPKCVNRKCQ